MPQTIAEQMELYEKRLLFVLDDIQHNTFCGTNLPIGEAGYACSDEMGNIELTPRGAAVLSELHKKYLTFSWQYPILN